MSKLKLNYWDLSKRVRSVMNTRRDNNMTNRTGVVYAKNEIKLPCLIVLGEVCGENKTGQ